MSTEIKNLEGFKEIYFKRFGIYLNDKEAYEKASKLLVLIKIIGQPK